MSARHPVLPRLVLSLTLAALVVAPPAGAQRPAAQDLESLEFRFIGPSNMSGRITALAVEPGDRNKTMYAAFASGGLWKTTNMGTTWEPVFDDQPFAAVADVDVAPSEPDVVWVGTGERNSLRSNSWGDGVYRSDDGGESWEHRGLTETTQIGRVVIHPDDPETVFVAALGHLWGPNPERGVYKTTDGGNSWRKVLEVNDTTGFVDLELQPGEPDVMLAASWHRLRWGGGHMEGAGAGSGIWRSTDGGESWSRLTDPDLDNGLPAEDLGRIGIDFSASDPDIVYAVIQVARSARRPDVSPEGGIFRSEDGGVTWARVHDFSAIPDYFYNEVWVDPTDPDRIYLGATRMARSDDGGRTVEELDFERVHVDHHALWIDPDDPEHLVVGNDGGVYVSWDRGETWGHQIIPASQFYEVDVDTTKVPYHVCGGMQDNGTWCAPNRTREEVGITRYDWYEVFGGDGFDSAVSPDAPHIRFHEYQYGNIYRLNTRTMRSDRLTPLNEDAGAGSGHAFRWDWNTPLELSSHDPTVLYAGGNHLFRMTERGDRWRILGPDMTRGNRFDPAPDTGHTSYRALHSVDESPLDPDVLWTGSNEGLLWISRDGGESWTEVSEGIAAARASAGARAEGDGASPPQGCWVGEIDASAHDTLTAYVAYDCHRRDDYRPHLYRTTDGGGSWTEITGDLPDDAGSWVVREAPVNPDLLFAGNERGVYVSTEGGGRWLRLEEGIPTAPVKDLEIVPRTAELVVGTYGRSIYILDISALEQLTPGVLASDAHLFEGRPARQYRTRDTYGSFGDRFFRTPNPGYGATIWYWLDEDAEGEVEMEIRRLADEGAESGGEPAADTTVLRTLTGSGEAGLQKVRWDLTRDEPRPRRLGDPASEDELRRVLPGTYEVRWTMEGDTLTRSVEVLDGWVERTPGRMR